MGFAAEKSRLQGGKLAVCEDFMRSFIGVRNVIYVSFETYRKSKRNNFDGIE